MRHVMSEAWTKISGRFFNIHLKLLRLGPGSMDRTRRQVSIFRKSDSPDDLERVSMDRWAAWASLGWFLIPVSAADLLSPHSAASLTWTTNVDSPPARI
jgi:hypothetical protein